MTCPKIFSSGEQDEAAFWLVDSIYVFHQIISTPIIDELLVTEYEAIDYIDYLLIAKLIKYAAFSSMLEQYSVAVDLMSNLKYSVDLA